jgi:hypothetical protein
VGGEKKVLKIIYSNNQTYCRYNFSCPWRYRLGCISKEDNLELVLEELENDVNDTR